MSGIRTRWHSALFVGSLATAFVARSQDGEVSLQTGPETETQLTASVVAGPNGEFYIRDNSDREVFAVDGERITQAAGDVSEMINDQVSAFDAPTSDFTRDSETSGRLAAAGEAGTPLAVESRSGSPLIDARLLRASGERRFVIQEELDSAGAALTVRRFVVAYDGSVGRTVAELDVGDVEIVDDSYIAIMDDTTAMHLAERAGGIVIEYVPLDAEIDVDALPPNRDTELAAPDTADDFDATEFRDRVRSAAPPRDGALLLPTPTRAGIVQSAREFLQATWVLSDANYGLDRDGQCRIPANVWSRPRTLGSARGTAVEALPYKWGGYMSVGQFLTHMQNGRLAGDVCTCRSAEHNFCLVPEAAGVDCSGFVSQVWGVDYATTSHLHEVSTPTKWKDLAPGDALNKPGAHVRLFLGFEDDAQLLVRVVESAVECGGVCERVLSARRFDGYRPIRRNGLAGD